MTPVCPPIQDLRSNTSDNAACNIFGTAPPAGEILILEGFTVGIAVVTAIAAPILAQISSGAIQLNFFLTAPANGQGVISMSGLAIPGSPGAGWDVSVAAGGVGARGMAMLLTRPQNRS